MKKTAVFSCPGLGDGLISLQLAYNLSLNGYEAHLFHDKNFYQLQPWTNVLIQKYPACLDIEKLFQTYEKIFVSQDLDNLFVQALIYEGKNKYPKRLFVLNPSPSKKIGSQNFYKDTYFKPDLCMVKNIQLFSKNILKLKKTTVHRPLLLTKPLMLLKDSRNQVGQENKKPKKDKKKKIVIHPVASRLSKSWKPKKFLKLAHVLEKQGFDVFFVMTEVEKKNVIWKAAADQIKTFTSLHELALFLSDATVFLGGDSGVGHLASALKIPTVSIFRSYRTAFLWRPGWGKNQIVAPSNLIPNISGFRLRDRNWSSFITVRKVIRKLMEEINFSKKVLT